MAGQQVATRRDGQKVIVTDPGQSDQQQPNQGSDIAQLAAAIIAAKTAGETAKAAPAVLAPAATAAASGAVSTAILTAFSQFLADRRQDQRQNLQDMLERQAPNITGSDQASMLDGESTSDRVYAAKARQRLAAGLQDALAEPDPEQRREQIHKLLDQERRFAEAHERAQADRVKADAKQRDLEVTSPAGARWVLGDDVKQHTPDCVAMAGKVWPHSLLRTYHPPLHAGCACSLQPVPADADVTPADHALLGSMQIAETPDVSTADVTVVLAETVKTLSGVIESMGRAAPDPEANEEPPAGDDAQDDPQPAVEEGDTPAAESGASAADDDELDPDESELAQETLQVKQTDDQPVDESTEETPDAGAREAA